MFRHQDSNALKWHWLALLAVFLCLVAKADDGCPSSGAPSVKLKIVEPTGSTQDFFNHVLCPESDVCSGVSVESNVGSLTTTPYTLVTITDHPYALEAVLLYVDAIRSSQVSGVGSTTGQVYAASGAYLLTSVIPTALYERSPPSPYAVELRMQPTCSSSTGFWGLALIGILPVAFILFMYAKTRGASKEEMGGNLFALYPNQELHQLVPPQTQEAAAASAQETAAPPVGYQPAQPGLAPPPQVPAAPESQVSPQEIEMQVKDDAEYEEAEGHYAYGYGNEDGDAQYRIETMMDENTGEVYQVYVDQVTGEMYRMEEEEAEEG